MLLKTAWAFAVRSGTAGLPDGFFRQNALHQIPLFIQHAAACVILQQVPVFAQGHEQGSAPPWELMWKKPRPAATQPPELFSSPGKDR